MWRLNTTLDSSRWRPDTRAARPLRDNPRTVNENQRRHYAISLHQAAQESPTLARLVERVNASSRRMEVVRPLLPAPLRASVQAGPMEEDQWCLLVSSNAVAAKLRQLLPTLRLQLQARGLAVASIRIKIINPTRP